MNCWWETKYCCPSQYCQSSEVKSVALRKPGWQALSDRKLLWLVTTFVFDHQFSLSVIKEAAGVIMFSASNLNTDNGSAYSHPIRNTNCALWEISEELICTVECLWNNMNIDVCLFVLLQWCLSQMAGNKYLPCYLTVRLEEVRDGGRLSSGLSEMGLVGVTLHYRRYTLSNQNCIYVSDYDSPSGRDSNRNWIRMIFMILFLQMVNSKHGTSPIIFEDSVY